MIRVVRFSADGSSTLGGPELMLQVPADHPLWIDVEGDEPEDRSFMESLGFHPMALSDAFTYEHQPKLEEYEGYLFLIVRGVDFNRYASDDLPTLKMAAFLDRRRLVTYHRAPLRSINAVRARLCDAGKPLHRGLDMLLYDICDELVEYYFPILDDIADGIETLEEEIFHHPSERHLEQIQVQRRRLTTLRRVMLPHRQVFNHLAGAASPFLDPQDAVYFRDVFDKVLRLGDAIDAQRELLSAAKDSYLSVLSHRTNEIMKFLTIFSSIMLPLTLIAGIYGMNFDNMPELRTRYGYFAVLGVMAAVAAGLVGYFYRKGWLGHRRE
jgi:magnesium transporter